MSDGCENHPESWVCFNKIKFNDNPKVKDYFSKEIAISCEEDLCDLYESDSAKQVEYYSKKLNTKIEKDDYLTWMLKRKICPWGLPNNNSKYWIEQISILDGEMGITLPYEFDKVPAIFFDALRIIRQEKSDKDKKNVK